ncbi:uncharacterized protein [Macaca nemestrina]|uniref:uncharacterized protein isoform X2 n=1 Tax=Macaca nemestrina TaxID=9545 RepID=UPI0039B8D97E
MCGWAGFSTWLQMTRFHPFLWLKNIPFWMYIAVSSSLHQWMNRVTQRRQPKWNVGSTFYNTRDRATMDEEGYIWFLGRSHDTINASGWLNPQLNPEPTDAEPTGEEGQLCLLASPDHRPPPTWCPLLQRVRQCHAPLLAKRSITSAPLGVAGLTTCILTFAKVA